MRLLDTQMLFFLRKMVDESMGRDPKGKGVSPNQHFFRGCVGFLKGIYEKLLKKNSGNKPNTLEN